MKRLDLHGLFIHDAWKTVARFIDECYYSNIKTCEIICGQGAIKQEIETWLSLNNKVRKFTITRTNGSYIVKLIKKDKK